MEVNRKLWELQMLTNVRLLESMESVKILVGRLYKGEGIVEFLDYGCSDP